MSVFPWEAGEIWYAKLPLGLRWRPAASSSPRLRPTNPASPQARAWRAWWASPCRGTASLGTPSTPPRAWSPPGCVSVTRWGRGGGRWGAVAGSRREPARRWTREVSPEVTASPACRPSLPHPREREHRADPPRSRPGLPDRGARPHGAEGEAGPTSCTGAGDTARHARPRPAPGLPAPPGPPDPPAEVLRSPVSSRARAPRKRTGWWAGAASTSPSPNLQTCNQGKEPASAGGQVTSAGHWPRGPSPCLWLCA